MDLMDPIAFEYGAGMSIASNWEDEDEVEMHGEVMDPQDSSSSHEVHAIAIADDDCLSSCTCSLT